MRTSSPLTASLIALLIAVTAIACQPERAQFPSVPTPTTAPIEASRLTQHAEQIRASEASPLAYPHVLSIESLEPFVSRQRIEQTIDDLLTQPTLDPLVAARLRWRRALLSTRRGDAKAARAQLRGLGMLTRWHVIGPFANEGGAGLTTAFAPEEQLDVGLRLDGRFPEMSWHPLESIGRGGYVALDSVLSPAAPATLYAATVIEADAPIDAVLWLGVDGGYRVWLNGELLTENATDIGATLDAEGFVAPLQPGANTLVIKVANEQGPAGFFARLTTQDIAPRVLTHGSQAPRAEQPLGQGDPTGARVPGPLERFEAAARPLLQGEPTERAHAMAWYAFMMRRLKPGSVDASSAESELLRAAELAPNDPLVAALSVEVLEEDWRQRELLEAALRAHPDEAWLLTLRVRQLIEADRYESTEQLDAYLERLEALAPESVSTELLLADNLERKNLYQAAWQRTHHLAARYTDAPAALEAMIWRAEHTRRHAQELLALDHLLAVEAIDDISRLERVRIALARGDSDDALAQLDRGLALQPDAPRLMRRKAEVLDALGRHDDADALYRAWLARRSTDASLWEVYGQRWLALGDEGRALVAFARALAIEPQNAELRQLVSYLDPQADSFEQPFIITDLDPLGDAEYGPEINHALRVDQKITFVYPDGLSSTYHQRVFDILTTDGARTLSYIPLFFTPGEEILEVDMVEVTRPDGSTRSIYERDESSAIADERYRMYYDYHRVGITLQDLAPGDRLELRYRLSETSQSNIFDNHFGDVWFIQDNIPRRLTRYVLIAPADRPLYFRTPQRLSMTQETSEADGRVTHVFTRERIPRVDSEANAPGSAEIADYLHVTTFADWGEVARWYWNLASEQWIVDRDIRTVVRELTDGVAERREIVRRIHNYVVKNTRYVALEFGIHGYKPYRTTVCFRRRFGDCKDKASLIKVMLEEAGVPADIVLVRTRRNGRIDTNPASLSIFDHAIAYVPEFDLFLDGTAEFSGTDELPAMDQGVTVLIVKQDGAFELRETPVSRAEENAIEQRFDFALSLDGPTSLEGSAKIQGQFAPEYRRRYESEERRRERLEDSVARDFPGAVVESVSFEQVADLEQPVSYQFRARIASPLRVVGAQRELFPIGHEANLVARLAPTNTRTHALVIDYPLTIANQHRWRLPEGLKVVKLPETVALETPFGALSLTLSQPDPRTIDVSSRLTLAVQRIEPKDYPAFRQFIVDVERAFETPITLE